MSGKNLINYASCSSPITSRRSSASGPSPRQLYELQAKLDAHQVYCKAEVEELCKVFYKPKKNQMSADHARMTVCIDPVVNKKQSIC